jgi:uncharacterized BrkB/YihY/UPF0761 family membrane protein
MHIVLGIVAVLAVIAVICSFLPSPSVTRRLGYPSTPRPRTDGWQYIVIGLTIFLMLIGVLLVAL